MIYRIEIVLKLVSTEWKDTPILSVVEKHHGYLYTIQTLPFMPCEGLGIEFDNSILGSVENLTWNLRRERFTSNGRLIVNDPQHTITKYKEIGFEYADDYDSLQLSLEKA